MPLESWQREFAASIVQHRREGWGWRYDGLESWASDKIFAQLRELGIDTDAERFHQQALTAGRIKVLDDDWDGQLSEEKKSTGFWQDFPMLAIPVLWARLADDLICPEIVEHHLHRVVAAEEDGTPLENVDGLPADLAAAMCLTRYLQGFPAAERGAKFKDVNEGGYYDYTGWLLELIEQRGAEYPDQAAQLADVMSDCTLADKFQTELAMSLAVAGRREEAVSRAQAVLQRFPDDIWVKILAADVFEQLDDDAEAIRLWLAALPMAGDGYEWDAVAERLADPFDRAGRTAELDDLLLTHPRPEPPPAPPSTDIPWTEPKSIGSEFSPPQRLTPKIGRNEPCPCGSGKKYKKCCMP